jgi:hypothetical protein
MIYHDRLYVIFVHSSFEFLPFMDVFDGDKQVTDQLLQPLIFKIPQAPRALSIAPILPCVE